jgi:hypothetical protein
MESLRGLKMQDLDFSWNTELQIKALKGNLRV